MKIKYQKIKRVTIDAVQIQNQNINEVMVFVGSEPLIAEEFDKFTDKITSFKVEGHTGYAPSGRDVVCAAASALVVGTINGLEALTDAAFDTAVSHGFTRVDVKEPTAYSNVLLNSMLL